MLHCFEISQNDMYKPRTDVTFPLASTQPWTEAIPSEWGFFFPLSPSFPLILTTMFSPLESLHPNRDMNLVSLELHHLKSAKLHCIFATVGYLI